MREAAASARQRLRALFTEVDWSVSYVGFLLYVFVIITYRLPVGDVAMAVALLGLAWEPRKFRVPGWLLGFGAFLGWAAVGYSVTSFPDVVWSNGMLVYLKLWLIILVAVNVLDTRARVRFFLVFFLFLFATHPIRGSLFNTFLYGYQEGGRTVWNGVFRNPNDLASLLLLPLGVACGLLRDRNKWVRYGALGSVVAIPVVIMLTQSRGGMLALGLFGAMTILAERKRLRTLAVVGVLAACVLALSPSGAIDRMEGLFQAVEQQDLRVADEEGSAQQRFKIWQVAGVIIDEHPVVGVGLGAYPNSHGLTARRTLKLESAWGQRDVHSTYLRILAETGFPGLLIFLAVIGVTLRRSYRTRDRYESLLPDEASNLRYLELALWAYLVAALFGSYAHLPFMWLHLALIQLAARALERRAETLRERSPEAPSPQEREARRPYAAAHGTADAVG